MVQTYKMLVGASFLDSARHLSVVNPATGEGIAEVPDCDRTQLDAAVAAARGAFPAWRDTPIEARGAMLAQAAARIAKHAEALKLLLTAEQGKPLDDAKFEIMGAALWLKAGSKMRLPVTVNEDSADRLSETRHVPLGVVGAIAPWNFPVLLSFWKIAPALMAGNTIVVKPSPFTPVTMLRIAELLADLLPPGVLNVVTGGDDLGPWMTAHPDINKISFTGSTPTGRRVMESAATNLKRVTLELGGNDPAIVLPDVDVEAVVPELFWAAFRNSGQICVATKRLYVHAAIYDRLVQALADYAKNVVVGDGAVAGTRLGPVQNRKQYDRVVELIEDCRRNGQRFLVGGDVDENAKGYFIPITIVDNPPDDSRVVAEEAFGPLLPVLKFDDVEDAIRRANASDYGLAASVWSSDEVEAQCIAARLEAGTVWINEAQHLAPNAAFAGHKQSGFGIENGLEGLLEYTVSQTVTIRRNAGAA